MFAMAAWCTHSLESANGRRFWRTVAGASWEGLAIESLIGAAPAGTEANFFRTSTGDEIDLLLKIPCRRKVWAIEIKRGSAPTLERGFHTAREAVRPERSLVVYGGVDRFARGPGVANPRATRSGW